MKRFWSFLVTVFLSLVPVLHGFAANGATTTTGEGSVTLTRNLYCNAKSLMEGQLGVLIGFIFVMVGLIVLIQSRKWIPALILILTGGLVTAVPNMIVSFFNGYGSMLKTSGISSADITSFSSLASGCSSSSGSSSNLGTSTTSGAVYTDVGTTSGNITNTN